MDKSLINRWIKALESGQYKEIGFIHKDGCYRKGDLYTIYGVLLDINQHLGYKWYKEKNSDYYKISFDKIPNKLSWESYGIETAIINKSYLELPSQATFEQAIRYLKTWKL